MTNNLENKKKLLEKIKRYDAFDKMIYRTNDHIHTERVLWITKELIPVAKKFFNNFDSERAMALALVHDDVEIFTGDYNASHKVHGTEKFISKINADELEAIEKLTKMYPQKIGKYEYKDLLLQAKEKSGIEAKIVSYADKIDAYCECVHEVLAGNIVFLSGVIFCTDRLSNFKDMYPELKEFLKYDKSQFTNFRVIIPKRFETRLYRKNFNKVFTKSTITKPTVFPFYDAWKNITIKNGKKFGLDSLLKQKEYLK